MHIAIVWCSLFIASAYAACLHGTNLAGLDFGTGIIPGVYGKDYISPSASEMDYFMGKGMNLFRLPFLWERLQSQKYGPLDNTYLGYLQTVVNYATSKGASVLLDPHNYARYFNQVIGDQVPVDVYQNMWSQLAVVFANNSRVIFGLMNEPNSMKTELWLQDANAAISAIRAVKATNLITVPGNAWTGAWSWYQNWYGTPNSDVMKGIVDPANNFVVEVHQYLDTDGSGTNAECVNTTIGSIRLEQFTTWARQNNMRALLGEWAGGRTITCYSAISDLLTFVANNQDVYAGWTWWAAGPWWGEYIYALDPSNGQDRPQMQYLLPHLTPSSC